VSQPHHPNANSNPNPNPTSASDSPADLTRRQMIVTSAGALAATTVLAHGSVAAMAQAVGPKFLTKDELTLLDELTEMILPADDHAPGARAAKCAAYIDARLAEAFEDEPRTMWREGLKAIDTVSQSLNGHRFMESSEAERTAVLTKLAQSEEAPKLPEEKFFVELKARTVHAYYTSEIGIHKEMEYKGNTLLQEYVGTDVSKPGPA
jgi:hypothetical protein